MTSFTALIAPHHGICQRIILVIRSLSLLLAVPVIVLAALDIHWYYSHFYDGSIFFINVAYAVLGIIWDVANLLIRYKGISIRAYILYIGEVVLIAIAIVSLGVIGVLGLGKTVVSAIFITLRGIIFFALAGTVLESRAEKRAEERVRRDLGMSAVPGTSSREVARGTTTSPHQTRPDAKGPSPEYGMDELEADFERESNMKFPVELSASVWKQESRSKFPARQITRPRTS